MHVIQKLLDLLSPQERKRAGLLLGMILIMSLLEMLGVASIMPFIAVLAKPELVSTNPILNYIYTKLRFTDTQQFLLALGMLVFVLLLLSLGFKTLTTYAQLRFTLMLEYSIGKRMLESYLHQPYSWFLGRNSADLSKTILSEVNTVIYQCATPIINLIAQGAVATALLMLLILIEPKLAIVVGLTLVAAYAIIFKIGRGFLGRIGDERVKSNQKRFIAVSEAFGAFKEIKVGGLEETYIKRFSDPARSFALHQSTAQVISQLPRFALEAIAFGGMLMAILYLMAESGSFASAVPIISLYAFAGYRLMPALQQIYGAVSQLRFAGPSIDAMHSDLLSLQPALLELINPSQQAIALRQSIKLNNINYSYPNATKPALNNLNMTIPAKSTVGFVGSSGTGKTTTVDLILGLLEAQGGNLEVDGQIIDNNNRRVWQRAIGYVPQHIYLADDTVAANIAFGLDPKVIDQNAVERAAKIANLHDFIENELSLKYQTTVGERGVRLSGGQRQRIGIARALYHNPQVLILDEATSALDNLTEQALMEAIHNLGNEITIIIIAHRLSTIKDCDFIFILEKGSVKARGTYTELSKNNSIFQKMIGTME